SIEQQAKLEKSIAEKEAKAEKKADAALKKKLALQVSIKHIERNKCKAPQQGHPGHHHCHPHHHSAHTDQCHTKVELKKAAKFLMQKYVMGTSVMKNAQGQDKIIMQGDMLEEVLELMQGGKGMFAGVPAVNVKIVEEKKKKETE
ncbi:hypothetical protein ID866_10850, partial [Astraeus odoratus]